LGVRRDATGFEIPRAYQSARRDFAADCFPGDLRRELARELDDIAHVLDEAFRVLRDDRLRRTDLAHPIDTGSLHARAGALRGSAAPGCTHAAWRDAPAASY